jgi:hypothetical protein
MSTVRETPSGSDRAYGPGTLVRVEQIPPAAIKAPLADPGRNSRTAFGFEDAVQRADRHVVRRRDRVRRQRTVMQALENEQLHTRQQRSFPGIGAAPNRSVAMVGECA